MKSIIQLTTVARVHAEGKGLLAGLQQLQLDRWVVTGDVIGVGQERFIVRERRIELAENGSVAGLVFVLDYPARASR